MKKTLTALVMLLLALGLVASGCPGEAPAPEVGKQAPDFELDTLDGQTVVLSQLQGKPVLLNFWATWCSPCVYEMPFLQQVHQDWPEDELVLLGVNIGESPSQAAEFMQSNGLSFTVLLDSQTAVAQKYNIEYIPTTFLIDREGIIQEIKVGSFQSKAEIENMLSQID
jgi:peroxiredoxin